MDEAIDQGGAIAYPEPGEVEDGRVARAAAELVRESGNRSVCSIPMTSRGSVVGALTFERASETLFDRGTIEVLESVGALVGPILEVQRRDDRWLLTRAFYSLRGLAGRLVGPRHVGLKLGTLGVLAGVLFAVFATGDFRVTADTVVEPARRQAIVAGFDGYVRTAPFRAGDIVTEGDVLATLDDRDLQLERTRWQSQADQGQRQYQAALGTTNAAEVQIFTAQIEQARAQVALLDEQIARTRIAAPFDGVVVTGDLSQSLGSPVGRGEVLFELAPLDDYRVILQVDERDVRHVEEGQSGQIVLAGFTDEPLPFSVRRLTPVSTPEEGRNYFRVEAELTEAPERLRPGMEGVGKITVDERRLVWIWSRELLDWVRLQTWTWLP
jgi:RND family efflux transporter MFP subunit